MAKYDCRCGKLLSTTAVPNDVEIWAYTDREWDKILEVDMIETWKIPPPKHRVWHCQDCERIYIFDENNKFIKCYILEQTE